MELPWWGSLLGSRGLGKNLRSRRTFKRYFRHLRKLPPPPPFFRIGIFFCGPMLDQKMMYPQWRLLSVWDFAFSWSPKGEPPSNTEDRHSPRQVVSACSPLRHPGRPDLPLCQPPFFRRHYRPRGPLGGIIAVPFLQPGSGG